MTVQLAYSTSHAGASGCQCGSYFVDHPLINVSPQKGRTVGDNKPNWKLLIRNGEDATTYLSAYESKIKARVSGAITTAPNFSPCEYVGCSRSGDLAYTTIPSLNDATLASADNKAKRIFLRKIISFQKSFSGATFLGELAETLRMIRNPARSFRRGIDDYWAGVKKLQRRHRGRHLNKAIADSWLEYAFGWSPLLSDIQDASKALQSLSQDHRQRQRIYAVASEREFDHDFDDGLTHYQMDSPAAWTWRVIRQDKATVVYRGLLDYNPTDTQRFINELGFNLEEFAPTVWEVIPYSFLIDYFTNVGDVINAWSYGRGSLKWSNRTAIVAASQAITDFNAWVAFNPEKYDFSFSPNHLVTSNRSVLRQSYYGDFVPDFSFRVPGMSTKWINLAALGRMKF